MKYFSVILFLLILSGCSSDNSDVESMSSIAKMEMSFLGNPPQTTIKIKLDEAMTLYGESISEENYSRAGSSLVAMRKKFGIKEIDILSHMIKSHTPGTNVTFPNAVAISAVALSYGDS